MPRSTRLALAAARRTYGFTAAAVPLRTDLPRLLNARRLTAVGAEVGVFLGGFTEQILEGWEGRRLIAIDPWSTFGDEEYRDVLNDEQVEQDRRYDDTIERLRRFGGRADIWRMTGDEAAARVDDSSLDWVYLDARHDRDSVAHDLRAWWPKVRAGGLFGGHDYIEGVRGTTEFGVRPAVDEFCRERGLRVHATFLDEPFVSWLIEVPGRPRARLRGAAGEAARATLLTARRLVA